MAVVKRVKSSKKQVVAEPLVSEPIVEVPVVVEETVTTLEPTDDVVLEAETSFSEVLRVTCENLNSMKAQIKNMERDFKTLKSLYKNELKYSKKSKKSKGPVDPLKKSHGMLKPALISDKLADFFGLPRGSELARPQATKLISSYVKEHELYGQKADSEGVMKLNKTVIIPDAKLRSLLGEPLFLYSKKQPQLGNGYNYFNLQSYLKQQKHFL
jgi:chromatin remodeling complex protein RSC6